MVHKRTLKKKHIMHKRHSIRKRMNKKRLTKKQVKITKKHNKIRGGSQEISKLFDTIDENIKPQKEDVVIVLDKYNTRDYESTIVIDDYATMSSNITSEMHDVVNQMIMSTNTFFMNYINAVERTHGEYQKDHYFTNFKYTLSEKLLEFYEGDSNVMCDLNTLEQDDKKTLRYLAVSHMCYLIREELKNKLIDFYELLINLGVNEQQVKSQIDIIDYNSYKDSAVLNIHSYKKIDELKKYLINATILKNVAFPDVKDHADAIKYCQNINLQLATYAEHLRNILVNGSELHNPTLFSKLSSNITHTISLINAFNLFVVLYAKVTPTTVATPSPSPPPIYDESKIVNVTLSELLKQVTPGELQQLISNLANSIIKTGINMNDKERIKDAIYEQLNNVGLTKIPEAESVLLNAVSLVTEQLYLLDSVAPSKEAEEPMVTVGGGSIIKKSNKFQPSTVTADFTGNINFDLTRSHISYDNAHDFEFEVNEGSKCKELCKYPIINASTAISVYSRYNNDKSIIGKDNAIKENVSRLTHENYEHLIKSRSFDLTHKKALDEIQRYIKKEILIVPDSAKNIVDENVNTLFYYDMGGMFTSIMFKNKLPLSDNEKLEDSTGGSMSDYQNNSLLKSWDSSTGGSTIGNKVVRDQFKNNDAYTKTIIRAYNIQSFLAMSDYFFVYKNELESSIFKPGKAVYPVLQLKTLQLSNYVSTQEVVFISFARGKEIKEKLVDTKNEISKISNAIPFSKQVDEFTKIMNKISNLFNSDDQIATDVKDIGKIDYPVNDKYPVNAILSALKLKLNSARSANPSEEAIDSLKELLSLLQKRFKLDTTEIKAAFLFMFKHSGDTCQGYQTSNLNSLFLTKALYYLSNGKLNYTNSFLYTEDILAFCNAVFNGNSVMTISRTANVLTIYHSGLNNKITLDSVIKSDIKDIYKNLELHGKTVSKNSLNAEKTYFKKIVDIIESNSALDNDDMLEIFARVKEFKKFMGITQFLQESSKMSQSNTATFTIPTDIDKIQSALQINPTYLINSTSQKNAILPVPLAELKSALVQIEIKPIINKTDDVKMDLANQIDTLKSSVDKLRYMFVFIGKNGGLSTDKINELIMRKFRQSNGLDKILSVTETMLSNFNLLSSVVNQLFIENNRIFNLLNTDDIVKNNFETLRNKLMVTVKNLKAMLKDDKSASASVTLTDTLRINFNISSNPIALYQLFNEMNNKGNVKLGSQTTTVYNNTIEYMSIKDVVDKINYNIATIETRSKEIIDSLAK